jgi:hypothetical protein
MPVGASELIDVALQWPKWTPIVGYWVLRSSRHWGRYGDVDLHLLPSRHFELLQQLALKVYVALVALPHGELLAPKCMQTGIARAPRATGCLGLTPCAER